MHAGLKVLFVSMLAAVAACTSSEIVSRGPDSVAIQVEDPEDLDVARDRAGEYCAERGMSAELERTETAGEDTAVAYFNCV